MLLDAGGDAGTNSAAAQLVGKLPVRTSRPILTYITVYEGF